jgi:hypothetical protein
MQNVYTKFILAQIRNVHEPIRIFQPYSWLRRSSRDDLQNNFHVTKAKQMGERTPL